MRNEREFEHDTANGGEGGNKMCWNNPLCAYVQLSQSLPPMVVWLNKIQEVPAAQRYHFTIKEIKSAKGKKVHMHMVNNTSRARLDRNSDHILL